MKQKNNVKQILVGILIFGFILRLVFSILIDINIFQIDIGISKDNFNYKDKNSYDRLVEFDRNYLTYGGHLEYILTIYKTGQLPNTNINQCYHPPLSHILFAGFMKCESIFTDNNKFLIESLEFLAIIYSMLTIIVVYKIMKKIGFDENQAILPISILTFHPLFIYLSRLVNTDGLVSLLILISVLYLLKWYKNPSYKNVTILAFAIGLGAMTKTSIIIMAVSLIVFYLKRLSKSIEDTKTVKNIIIQGLLFTVITLPMVFWYQFRNYYKFNQNLFGIVEALDTLKVANNSFKARWILNNELFNEVYEMNASNVWANLIISTINFSMESKAIPFLLSMVLRGLSLLLIILSIISIFKYTVKSENKDLLLILITIYITWIARIYLF